MSKIILPLTSAQLISKLATHVKINESGIKELAEKFSSSLKSNKYEMSMWKKAPCHPKVADEKAVEWIFIIDSLNFSFWPEEGMKYSINSYTGYFALCSAINRAIDDGIPITDPNYYSNISEDDFRNIFRTDNGKEIPMLKERLLVLREHGMILIKQFEGSFLNCVKQSSCRALDLLSLIVTHFPSFRDESTYKQNKVTFYKRAQILIADIWACFEGKALGRFDDINELTMFADYRVPQVLAYFNAIQYSQELMNELKQNQILLNGEEKEVEIRGISIWAVELIKRELKKSSSDDSSNQSVNSILIDFYLWDYRRQFSEDIENKIPFHKTRSIYY